MPQTKYEDINTKWPAMQKRLSKITPSPEIQYLYQSKLHAQEEPLVTCRGPTPGPHLKSDQLKANPSKALHQRFALFRIGRTVKTYHNLRTFERSGGKFYQS